MRPTLSRPILLAMARELVVEEQPTRVPFAAFFDHGMLYAVVYGLVVENTPSGRGTVRAALQERASALEAGSPTSPPVLRARGPVQAPAAAR